ncbi:MAG TPA: two-component system response regulator [Verrucomicrobia bacterium]|nr:MAG: two-component system response regulator [Lentisphaerae bacterium GWF2_57_35]HBA84781.1 two-component system response regulator [Verrucomicrobiota bacterium]
MNDNQVEIILMEDDPNDVELIMRALRKCNLLNKIVILKDGAEALDYLYAQGIHMNNASHAMPKVVLLDLKLPKVNGLEVLRKLKADERTKLLPVVVLTSSREQQDIENAYKMGANSYVTKPVNFEEFAKAVTSLGMYWLMLNRPPKD